MGKSFLSGFVVAGVATSVLLAGESTARADGWQVSKVSGQAWETTGGGHKSLTAGATLDEGATIVTGERSRVMLVRRTETIVVGPVSVVAVAEHPDQQLSTTVLQKGGTVTFDVEKRNVQHFSVETPMLAAVVKGTHFTVKVGRATGNVSVDRGTVQVTSLASGQTTAITQGQRASVDQHGLSVSGQGRPVSVTRTTPRAALVSPLSEVTPATTVSASEFAAAQNPGAPQAPARNPGLFSATMSLFAATPSESVGHGAAAVSNAATEPSSTQGDRSAHTSASTPASGNSTPSQSTGGVATGIGGTGSVAAAGIGSVAAAQAGASSSGSGTASAAGVSSQGGPGSGRSATAGAATASSGSSGTANNGQGPAGGAGSAGASPATSSPGSSAKSDNGQGNGGTPGNGGQNGAASSSGSSGKSDQGKGNGGTPGNGGVNGGAAASGNAGKSDRGVGNGGTPGNGHGHQN